MRTIAEVSKEALKIEEFLQTCKPGETIAYADIQRESGVAMNTKGKGYLRTALHRLGLEYTAIRGFGIELACGKNGFAIIGSRLKKINSSVKRADKTQKTIQDKFWSELSDEDKKRVLFTGAIFGAIKLASGSSRQLFGKKELPQLPLKVEIPVF